MPPVGKVAALCGFQIIDFACVVLQKEDAGTILLLREAQALSVCR
jgi:hypothetical protein